MASQPVARFSILRDAPDPDRPLVLSIEDEAPHRRHLVGTLEADGFRVESAASADEARELLRGPAPDIVLLDLGLPDMDGVDLCRRLVVWPAVPIIVVSADHDEPRVLSAFEAGAVDYVTKPFSATILVARVRAALRSRGAAAAPPGDAPIVVGDLVLDRSAHLVMVGGETIELRPREFTVLELLAANEGALVSYAVLVGRRPGNEVSLAELKALRIVISRVRAAIGTGPRTPLIHTGRASATGWPRQMGEASRRQLTALGLGLGGIAVIVVGFLPFNHHVDAAVPGLLLLVPVVLASAMGGWKVAVPVAVVAALSYSIAFLPPLGRPHVSSARDIASLVTFVSVGLLVALIAGRRAERGAAELDDQRAMLLRTVSHDLRSPLHTIMTATDQLAADGTVDAERSELLGVVAGESRRLDRIVANMLSAGRLDAGVLVPDRSPEYLPALVAATVRRIEASGARSVTVAIDLDVGDVSVDAVQFDQVLTNLVDNAIRHSPPDALDAPVVVAATRRGDEVEVSVSDEGPGFPPEVVAAGPQPYRSGDRSAGVGLGLVVCQGIVTAHGGRLTLANRPSGGAVATFTLPVGAG